MSPNKAWLTLCLFLALSFSANAQTEPIDTDTPSDGYRNVSTLDHLRWISENPSSWNKKYELDNDIDASATSTWNSGEGWEPIGTFFKPFKGKFNGNGYKISNLYINRADENRVGFFGRANSADISDLGLVNINVTGGHNTGGFCGNNVNTSIKNCYTTGSVSGAFPTGGFCGTNGTLGEILNSYSECSVSGNVDVGGFCGANTTFALIKNCYSTGSVSGSVPAGGFCGSNTIASEIFNCYSTGYVDGIFLTGGFCGLNSLSDIEDCFWNIETSGHSESDGGSGKSNSEMQHINTYTDEDTPGLIKAWDFLGNINDDNKNKDRWRLIPRFNSGFPILSWQELLPPSAVYVSNHFDAATLGWEYDYFNNLDAAISALEGDSIHISFYTYTGDVDFTDYTVIIGDEDFILDGNIIGGSIQTPTTGNLVILLEQGKQKKFPLKKDADDLTVKIIVEDNPDNPPIGVKLIPQPPTDLPDDVLSLNFWEISGPEGLNATIIFRLPDTAIAGGTLPENVLIRYWNGERYVPISSDNVTIEDFGTYYEITITNVNEF